MKRRLTIVSILFLVCVGIILFLLPGVANAQPPSIPLMVIGVEDCKVEFKGNTYYPETDILVLSGSSGDTIKITKGFVTKYYRYSSPMESPFLYVDMDIISDLPFIQRVIIQLRRMA